VKAKASHRWDPSQESLLPEKASVKLFLQFPWIACADFPWKNTFQLSQWRARRAQRPRPSRLPVCKTFNRVLLSVTVNMIPDFGPCPASSLVPVVFKFLEVLSLPVPGPTRARPGPLQTPSRPGISNFNRSSWSDSESESVKAGSPILSA
jgi:hypothetical protein